ncbi:hypothetical protein B0H11DRAFT_2377147 [Mycena galericulata]|nr:hypothetical protein B0H11DRAFT_2377147 [Mycena galericulata]
MLMLSLGECRQILADAPQILPIFQMLWLADKTFTPEKGLFDAQLNSSEIRFLLGVSWHAMRTAICSLQACIGTDATKLRVLFSIATVLPGMRERWKDLARGCINVINLRKRSEIPPIRHWNRSMSLGRILRSSPTCPTLLPAFRDISCDLSFKKKDYFSHLVVSQDLTLNPYELHNIVQWLKSFQRPPLDLIELWNGYLETSRRLAATGEEVGILRLRSGGSMDKVDRMVEEGSGQSEFWATLNFEDEGAVDQNQNQNQEGGDP